MNIYYIISLILINATWIVYVWILKEEWIHRTIMLLKMDADQHREVQELFYKEFPWEKE